MQVPRFLLFKSASRAARSVVSDVSLVAPRSVLEWFNGLSKVEDPRPIIQKVLR
jgi:hypothetical protein